MGNSNKEIPEAWGSGLLLFIYLFYKRLKLDCFWPSSRVLDTIRTNK